MSTKISKWFTLEEFTDSQQAARLGISNQPSSADTLAIVNTAMQLDSVRNLLAHPVIISSGYRSPALNAHTPGSSPTSQHMKGEAADFTCPGFGTPLAICKAIIAARIPFDQLIFEYGRWVHISFARNGVPRREVLTYDSKGKRPGLPVG